MPRHPYRYGDLHVRIIRRVAGLTPPDLKEGNILVTIEDDKVIPELIKSVQTKPLLWKESKSRHPIFESRNDFGNLKAFDLIPKLADFGCAERGDVEGCKWVHPIQPNAYRAPEVLLGTGWSYSADIWNLGLVVRKHLHIT